MGYNLSVKHLSGMRTALGSGPSTGRKAGTKAKMMEGENKFIQKERNQSVKTTRLQVPCM